MTRDAGAVAKAETNVVDAVFAEFFERLRGKDGMDTDLIASLKEAWAQGKLKEVKTLQGILTRKVQKAA